MFFEKSQCYRQTSLASILLRVMTITLTCQRKYLKGQESARKMTVF